MKQKVLRKIFTGVIVLTLIMASFTGCKEKTTGDNQQKTEAGSEKATTSNSDDPIVIGISVGTLKQERWVREIDMFKEYANANGVEVVVQSAEDEAQKQMSQCENLISQGVDVLIVQALDSEAAGAIVASAHEAGIPVVAYDRFVRNGDLDYYITFDSVKVGEVQAKFVVDQAPKGNYIWLKGGAEDFNAHLVYEGHKNVLQPYIDNGDVTIVLEQWCKGWDPKEAMAHTENGLTLAENDVQAVIASNDGTAGGAIQALAAQGLAGVVPIAGQDADVAACQRIVEGTQTGTVYKPLKLLNTAAMQLAIALAKGENPKEKMDATLGVWTMLDNGTKEVETFSVDVIAVDKDNMVDVIIKDEFHTIEEVYANIPKDQWPNVNK